MLDQDENDLEAKIFEQRKYINLCINKREELEQIIQSMEE